MDATPVTIPAASAPATRKVGVRTKANRNCCLVMLGILLAPLIALGIYLVWPVAPLGPLPDTWQVGGPELTAEWSIPTSPPIRPDCRSVSPWILTQRGAYYCSTVGTPMSLERWDMTDRVGTAPKEFQIYSGTATSDTLWLVGLTSTNVPQLRAYDPETLAERTTVELPQDTIPVELLYGIDLIATPDDHLLLLLEPRAREKANATNFGCWFDPATSTFTAPIRMPGYAELPDMPLTRASRFPESLIALVGDGQTLRLRPRWNGPHDYLVSLTTGEAVEDPTQAIDFKALPRSPEALPASNISDYAWVSLQREPSLRLEYLLDARAGHPAASRLDVTNPETVVHMGKSLLVSLKGNPELTLRTFYAGITLRGLSLAQPEHAATRTIDDPMFIQSLNHEFPINQGPLFHLVGWSEQESLVLHPVLRPPMNINGGSQILRLGILDADTAQIAWHGWIPWAKKLESSSDWRVAAYGDALVITCTGASIDETDMWNAEGQPGYPMAVRIDLPPTLRSPWWGELETTY